MFSTATAQGLQAIPKWTFTGSQACYDFDSAKKLIELDSELVLCRETIPKLRLTETQLQLALIELTTALDARDTANKLLLTEVNKCFDEKKDLVKQLHEAETQQFDMTISFITGGVGIVVGVILGLVFTR